ncbi:TRAP transporter substrate-binding protein [Ralstonia sp. 1B3]
MCSRSQRAVVDFRRASPCGNAPEATPYPALNFHTQNLQAFASAVSSATNGGLKLEVYPNGTLLKPAAIFDGVKDGKAEAGEVMLSTLAQRDPLFGVDSIPFVVSGYNDARLLWDASRSHIEALMKANGLRLLYAVPWPPQNLYSETPIARLSDLKGHRLRTYNAAQKRIAELYGAQAVQVEAADLTAAIAGGRIDTMVTSPSTGLETKAGQRMTYYYKVNAWIPKNAVFVNEARFAKLRQQCSRRCSSSPRITKRAVGIPAARPTSAMKPNSPRPACVCSILT